MLAISVATSSAIEGVHLHIMDDKKSTWAVAVRPEKASKTATKKAGAACHESEASYRSRR